MNNNSSGPTGPNIKISTGTTGSSGHTRATCSTSTTMGNWVTVNISNGWLFSTTQNQPIKKKDDRDGCDCRKCKEFYPYAEPNEESGTLLCYRCRIGW